jgi:23S rRNA (pseudouridine1915-N3)-methyltransferase
LKLRLLCVGKTSEAYLREGMEQYQSRIRRYLPFSLTETKEEKGGKKTDPQVVREREGDRLLEKIPPDAFVVVLDERGKMLDSHGMAALFDNQRVLGASELVWVIGGAYGLSDSVKKRGDLLLSLSAMTFTHQMVRLFLLEQIYRGLTIWRNEPYHNE